MNERIECARACIESVYSNFDFGSGPFSSFLCKSPLDILIDCGFDPGDKENDFRLAVRLMREVEGTRRSLPAADRAIIDQFKAELACWRDGFTGPQRRRPVDAAISNNDSRIGSFVSGEVDRFRSSVNFKNSAWDKSDSEVGFSGSLPINDSLSAVLHLRLPLQPFGYGSFILDFPFSDYEAEPCNLLSASILGYLLFLESGVLPYIERNFHELLLWDMWSDEWEFSKISNFIDFTVSCISCMDPSSTYNTLN